MIRRCVVVLSVVSALLIPAGAALADGIPTPAVGKTTCGVSSGTVYVQPGGPGPWVYVNGAEADFSGC